MNERNRNQCIVLLPSSPYFDRFFEEILSPAIIETGLSPSRLQWSSLSPTPVNLFVDEIECAGALFADISEGTPEIWLAIGCAIALGIPLCLVSSKLDFCLPLGVQHLPVIPYPHDAFPGDYAQLQQNIFTQLSTTVPQPATTQSEPQIHTPFLPPSPAPAVSDDLVSYEVMALTIIDLKASSAGLSPRDLGLEMQARGSAHLTSHAMNALKRRRFIERKPVQISQGDELHISENLFITRAGQDWLTRHGRRSTTHRSTARPREQSFNKR
jgi:hypothetical protein